MPPGTKIYRVIEENGKVNGPYWAYELPNSKAQWRADYAVKEIWNSNGYYVEYTIPKDKPLIIWEGKAASQLLESHPGWLQLGGEDQVYIPNSDLQIPKNLVKKETNWR